MGKNNLILGTARGKLGDVVFYRTGGEQRFRTRVRPTNPRTDAQLLQRCVVSTAVKFYSLYSAIGDHAFQNFEGALKNHQRFMKLNIDYLRKIALQNVKRWSPIEFKTTNVGNFTWKDSPLIALNEYQISEGDLPSVKVQANLSDAGGQKIIGDGWNMTTEPTYQDVANNLGVQAGDQLTIIVLYAQDDSGYIQGCKVGRVVLAPADGNLGTNFFTSGGAINNPNAENYGEVTLTKSTEAIGGSGKNGLAVTVQGVDDDYICGIGVITSRFEGNVWRRSTSFINAVDVFLNQATLQSAMASYLKSDTSSLYLNQANDGDVDTRTRELEIQSRSLDVEEVEEKPKQGRRSKREE